MADKAPVPHDLRNAREPDEAIFEESRRRIALASRFLPGGVSSNFRLGMRHGPLVFERASGPYLFDVDGNRLIDYYLGMGPMILGHDPAVVREAAIAQMSKGLLFGGQSLVEAEAGELFCSMVPCAEKVRFCGSGSEAVQLAWRLARAFTGRNVIVKFEGHYHGWLDSVLVSTNATPENCGPVEKPNRNSGSKGQDAGAWANTDVLTWNDLAAVEARLARGDVAAVMMEPAMCNAGAIMPAPGYLEGVRAACSRHGALLIFDEVITGFRVAPGGAQEVFGVTPDLATFGKCLANGFSMAAVGGRADVLELSATGGVLHGGTHNAQPIAMAATLATMKALADGSAIKSLVPKGEKLMAGIRKGLAAAGIKAQVSGFPQIFHVAFGLDEPARGYRDLMRMDKARYSNFCGELLKRRVRALERGAWFLSTEHDDAVIDATIAAVADAARAI